MFDQIRYYGYNDNNGYLNTSEGVISRGEEIKNKLINNNVFQGKRISQIGIQTVPGISFYLNFTPNSQYPIIIGPTGIFELSLDSTIIINQIKFDENSLKLIESEHAYLIIDYIYTYEQEGE